MKSSASLLSYPKLLVGASAVGLVAAFWQAAERVHMLKFPNDPLSCNLNPVVDCGGVLGNKLAAVFGPPNAFIGIVAFSLLLAFGVQRLSGGEWTRPVRYAVVILSKIMLAFSIWFFAVSLYSIGKVCIFCIFIWAASIPIGIFGVKDFYENESRIPKLFAGPRKRDFIVKNAFTIVIFTYAAMIILFFLKFSDYYFA